MTYSIAIASGKGGTGKTMVAANLALTAPETVYLLDCDIKTIPPSFSPELLSSARVISTEIRVQPERCNGCGRCRSVCRFGAISVFGKRVLFFPERCRGCGACILVCSQHAIHEHPRTLGWIEISGRNGVRSVRPSGLDPRARSSSVIQQLRAAGGRGHLTLIDAPSGTGDTVISAIRGVRYVLLVTEDTALGIHDLVLLLEAVRSRGIPHGLVINRCASGKSEVREFADEQGVRILLEIPFSREIAAAQALGKAAGSGSLEIGNLFRSLWMNLLREIEA